MSVYFIGDGCGHVKIGHSVDPEERLRSLQAATPLRLEILRLIDGGQKTELWLHRKYKEYRVHREWFVLSQQMMTVVTPDELPPPPHPAKVARDRRRGAVLAVEAAYDANKITADERRELLAGTEEW